MRKFRSNFILICGLLLTLAAVPVFAQEEKVEINKMSFKDFARQIEQQIETEKIDLTKSFSVELEGVLMKDGRLDTKNSKFTKSEGDAAMVEVGKKCIEAVSDSGLFGYLKQFGVENIRLSLAQNDEQITANIISELATAEKVKTISSSLNMMRRMIPMLDRAKKDRGEKGFGDDEMTLFDGLNVSGEGKTLTINLAYEKSVIHEMIKRNINEGAAK